MALASRRRGRRTNREDTVEESTPAQSPRLTLRSIFRRLLFHRVRPSAVVNNVIAAAHTGSVGDSSRIAEATHSRLGIEPTSPSSHISSADPSPSHIHRSEQIKTVVPAITFKLHATHSSSSSSIATSESRHQYATAADIPPELYDLILYFMRTPRAEEEYDGEQACRNRVVVGKRELGRLGLVCWSWARMCQAKMYEVLILRSLDDYRMLETLASHRCSRISEYIEHFQLIPYSEATPWIHAVCLKDRRPGSISVKREGPGFPSNTGLWLVLYGNDGLAVLKWGLHAALPRRVPGTFSQGIKILHLDGIELPGMGEVVRLSRALPSLQELYFWDVTWAAPPSTDVEAYTSLHRRPGKMHAPVKGLQMMAGCTETWVVLHLLCLLDTSRPLCADDLAAVAKLAQTLTSSVEKVGYPKPLTRAKRLEWGHILSVRATVDRLLAPQLSFTVVQDVTLRFWNVDVIVLDFIHYRDARINPLRAMAGYDWASIDQHAAGLPFLCHIIVGLITRNDVAFFAKEIEPKMPLLSRSGRLKYAFHYIDSSKIPSEGWVACMPGKVADKDLVNSMRVHVLALHTLYS